MEPYDLIVQGGGLTGLALAACLADTNVRVACVEARPIEVTLSAPFDGRVTAIALGSCCLLQSCGAWSLMQELAEPIRHIEVAEAGGIGVIHYDAREVGDGPMGYIVENRTIRNALVQTIEAATNVELVAPFTVKKIERMPAKIVIYGDGGRKLQGRLLALCEGRLSASREKLGFASKRSDYEQTGIVCTLAHEKPHEGRAVERFFADGPFAILPLNGNRSSIVWALEKSKAEQVVALDDEAFAAEVTERFGDKLGKLELEGPRWHYPLVLVTSDELAKDRVALVGDTARGIHPIAGQGWNLALRDVATIAELVADAVDLGLDPGDDLLLERYCRWRSFDSLTLVTVTDGITRLFSNDLGPVHMLRDAGLFAVERLPSAKRLFMRHAMGTLGELPKLMRGEPLC